MVHLVQFLLEEDPSRVVLSIDSVCAFDHVSRALFFEELVRNDDLRNVLPFVRQWYSGQTEFVWHDSDGQAHQVVQGERAPQTDPQIGLDLIYDLVHDSGVSKVDHFFVKPYNV